MCQNSLCSSSSTESTSLVIDIPSGSICLLRAGEQPDFGARGRKMLIDRLKAATDFHAPEPCFRFLNPTHAGPQIKRRTG